jgi:hypothetical protein
MLDDQKCSGEGNCRLISNRDHRSIANMIEVLVRKHCDEVGIIIPEQQTLFGDE